MTESARVVGHISPVEPWGMSTNVQSLTEVLAQSAHCALSDLHVQIWTAQSAAEIEGVKAVLTELHTSLLTSLATADTLIADFQRTNDAR